MRVEPGAPPVAVSGVGVVTALGVGAETNWRRLVDGESGVRTIHRFPTDGLRTHIGALVAVAGDESCSIQRRGLEVARPAVREALDGAGFRSNGFPGPLQLAAPPSELTWPERAEAVRILSARGRGVGYAAMRAANRALRDLLGGSLDHGWVAGSLCEDAGILAPPTTVSTACASGATAIQLAVEVIRSGRAPAALAVGTDASVSVETLARFSLLSALSTANAEPTAASRPFSRDRDGFVMGEGAAALVLESADSLERRGAEPLAWIAGCGEASDTFHRTRSTPDGSRIVRCMRNALCDAGLDAEDVDHINAHGTSTPENDKMESLGIRLLLGERAGAVPVTANKSMVGHTLSAAGAVEAVFAVLTLRHGVIPPTINHRNPDPSIPLDVVPNRARRQEVHTVLSNSFGFGGQNVSLVIVRQPGRRASCSP